MAKTEPSRTDAPPRTLSLPYKRTRVRETYIAPDDRKRAKHIALSSNDTLQYIAEPKALETLDTIEVGDLILAELKNGGLGLTPDG